MKFDCNFLQALIYKSCQLTPLSIVRKLPHRFWHALFYKHWPEIGSWENIHCPRCPELDRTIHLLSVHYLHNLDYCAESSFAYEERTEEEKGLIDKMADDVYIAQVESGNTQ